MRSRAWLVAVGSILGAAAMQGACGSGDSGVGGAGGGNGGAGASTSTTVGPGGSGGTGGTTTTTTKAGGGGAGGGTGGSGGQGTGGGAEACPGQPQSFGVGTHTLTGSTTGRADDFQVTSASCFGGADTSGPDVVYAVTFTANSTVTATLTGTNGLDAVLYAESTCGNASSELFCFNQSPSAPEVVTFPAAANQTIFLIVDGNAGSSGDYSLKLEVAAAACGDGTLNAGEQCDDGDTMSGDGCSSTCQTEMPTDTSESCPGDVVAIGLNQNIDIQGVMPAPIGNVTTSNYADNYQTCESPSLPPNGAKDRVFQFVASGTGTMTVELRNIGANGGFDGQLSGWKDTCLPAPALNPQPSGVGIVDAPVGLYLGCSDQADGMTAYQQGNTATYESLPNFTVNAGESIFIVVDGYDVGSDGEFWLHASLVP